MSEFFDRTKDINTNEITQCINLDFIEKTYIEYRVKERNDKLFAVKDPQEFLHLTSKILDSLSCLDRTIDGVQSLLNGLAKKLKLKK